MDFARLNCVSLSPYLTLGITDQVGRRIHVKTKTPAALSVAIISLHNPSRACNLHSEIILNRDQSPQ